MVTNLSGTDPILPPELAKIVIGYAQDTELNVAIAKTGRLALAHFPKEFVKAFTDITEVTLPNWQQVHVTPEQLQKLQEAYPQLKKEGIRFEGENEVSSLEQETNACMFDEHPPVNVTLTDGRTQTIMAVALTNVLSGWAVEGIDWSEGRDVVQARPIEFQMRDIRSVRKLAPDFETWAALQLGRVHIADK